MTVVVEFDSKIKENILNDICPKITFTVFSKTQVYVSNVDEYSFKTIKSNSRVYSEYIVNIRKFDENVKNRAELLKLLK